MLKAAEFLRSGPRLPEAGEFLRSNGARIVIPFQVAYLRNAGKLMNCLLRRLSALGLVPRFEYNTPLKEMCLLQANKPPAAAGTTSKQRLAFASARPTARSRRVQKVEHDQSKNNADFTARHAGHFGRRPVGPDVYRGRQANGLQCNRAGSRPQFSRRRTGRQTHLRPV